MFLQSVTTKEKQDGPGLIRFPKAKLSLCCVYCSPGGFSLTFCQWINCFSCSCLNGSVVQRGNRQLPLSAAPGANIVGDAAATKVLATCRALASWPVAPRQTLVVFDMSFASVLVLSFFLCRYQRLKYRRRHRNHRPGRAAARRCQAVGAQTRL